MILKNLYSSYSTLKNKIYSKELVLFLTLLDALMHFKLEPLKEDSQKSKVERYKLYNYFFLSSLKDNIQIKQTFLKKKTKNKITFIRAPYRGKNAQIHLTKKFYRIKVSIKLHFKKNNWENNNNNMFIYLITSIPNLFKFFSSNHLTQWSKEIIIYSTYRF